MSEAVPQRIGDREREQAVALLREHHVQGRLTDAELEERTTTALAARTQDDLNPLFADLPGYNPDPVGISWNQPDFAGQQLAQVDDGPAKDAAAPVPSANPGRPDLRYVLRIAIGLAWPAAIMLMIITGSWWWLMIPIFLMPALRSAVGSDAWRADREARRHYRRERRDRYRELGPGNRD